MATSEPAREKEQPADRGNRTKPADIRQRKDV